jgi:hypothetical protein
LFKSDAKTGCSGYEKLGSFGVVSFWVNFVDVFELAIDVILLVLVNL